MDYSTVWHVFLLFVLMIMVVWFSMSRGKIIHKNPDLQSQKAEVKIDSPKNRKKLKNNCPFYFLFPISVQYMWYTCIQVCCACIFYMCVSIHVHGCACTYIHMHVKTLGRCLGPSVVFPPYSLM